MKIVFFIIFSTFYIVSFGQKNNPYATLKFDKVIMYDFEPGGGKGGSIVEADGKLTKNISKQVKLDSTTIFKLNQKLGDSASFNWGDAACFDPHLGFVYYKGKNIVGYITICTDCNVLSANIKLPAQRRSKAANDAHGMSKSFRKFLKPLLKKNNFSHQILPGSSYDE